MSIVFKQKFYLLLLSVDIAYYVVANSRPGERITGCILKLLLPLLPHAKGPCFQVHGRMVKGRGFYLQVEFILLYPLTPFDTLQYLALMHRSACITLQGPGRGRTVETDR